MQIKTPGWYHCIKVGMNGHYFKQVKGKCDAGEIAQQ